MASEDRLQNPYAPEPRAVRPHRPHRSRLLRALLVTGPAGTTAPGPLPELTGGGRAP